MDLARRRRAPDFRVQQPRVGVAHLGVAAAAFDDVERAGPAQAVRRHQRVEAGLLDDRLDLIDRRRRGRDDVPIGPGGRQDQRQRDRGEAEPPLCPRGAAGP